MMSGAYKEWNQTMMEDMFCEDNEWSIQGVEPNYDGRHASKDDEWSIQGVEPKYDGRHVL